MKQIKIPERLTETISIRLTKEEMRMVETLAKKYKSTRNLILRHGLQTIWEQEKGLKDK